MKLSKTCKCVVEWGEAYSRWCIAFDSDLTKVWKEAQELCEAITVADQKDSNVPTEDEDIY